MQLTFMRVLTKLMLLAMIPGICNMASAADNAYVAAEGHLLIAQGDCPSLSEAVERVRRQYNGRIVSAETRIRGNRETHHIRVLTDDGKVTTVRIPGCPRSS